MQLKVLKTILGITLYTKWFCIQTQLWLLGFGNSTNSDCRIFSHHQNRIGHLDYFCGDMYKIYSRQSRSGRKDESSLLKIPDGNKTAKFTLHIAKQHKF